MSAQESTRPRHRQFVREHPFAERPGVVGAVEIGDRLRLMLRVDSHRTGAFVDLAVVGEQGVALARPTRLDACLIDDLLALLADARAKVVQEYGIGCTSRDRLKRPTR